MDFRFVTDCNKKRNIFKENIFKLYYIGSGTTSLGSGGFIPYPGYKYFLDDLWYFDLSTNLWTEVAFPYGSELPEARMDMVFFIMDNNTLFMHG
jgi:hypothetical protein